MTVFLYNLLYLYFCLYKQQNVLIKVVEFCLYFVLARLLLLHLRFTKHIMEELIFFSELNDTASSIMILYQNVQHSLKSTLINL